MKQTQIVIGIDIDIIQIIQLRYNIYLEMEVVLILELWSKMEAIH